MNNEPVVYWNGGKVLPSSDEDFLYPDEREAQLESLKRVGLNAKTQFDIPLYTAPKELTDEEIMKIWYESLAWAMSAESLESKVTHGVYFARAILRKAQEK